jgi:HAD superfamily hydrolase (TIGR01450 family)
MPAMEMDTLEAEEAVIDPAIAARVEAAMGFIFDMDGTIALGDQASGGHVALPGAVDLLAELRRNGVPFCVFTNGTAKAPASYARTLRGAGLDVHDHEMMTPSSAAADYFVRNGLRRVRVLGTTGTAAPLVAAGLEVIGPHAPAEGVEAVYTGWFREFTFPDLEAACEDLWNGAVLTTASHVPFFATNDGRGIGTSFAINVMLTALTGQEAKVLGKPSREALLFALRLMKVPEAATSQVVVLGDDPGLETKMARESGCLAVGMTTGIHDRQSFEQAEADRRPNLILDTLEPLRELVRRRGAAYG